MSKLEKFLISKLQQLINYFYNKTSKPKIIEKEFKSETHLQKFLIDIVNNLDKTRLCPFCNSELDLAIGYGYWYDEHIKYYKHSGTSQFFEINDKQIQIFPHDRNYNELAAPDKVIEIPKDMIFNNIQELDNYLNKIVIFS